MRKMRVTGPRWGDEVSLAQQASRVEQTQDEFPRVDICWFVNARIASDVYGEILPQCVQELGFVGEYLEARIVPVVGTPEASVTPENTCVAFLV